MKLKKITGKNSNFGGVAFKSHGDKKQKKQHTIVRTVTLPVVILVIAESVMLLCVLLFNNVIGKLNENSENILIKQVENRARYLNNLMLDWSDLSKLSDTINSATTAMLKSGQISLATLDSDSEACTPLILEITDDLISTMYSKRVSGIYVIFNTQDLNKISKRNIIPDKTGIYIRDMDPSSVASIKNEDLLLERAPIGVCRSLNIANDSGWKPRFSFVDIDTPENYAYFSEPAKAAFAATGKIRLAADYGYWGTSAAPLIDSELTAVTYSVPLVLDNGTIYGVLGIDVLDNYLLDQLPYSELQDDSTGSYFVLKQRSNYSTFRIATPFLAHGKAFEKHQNLNLRLDKSSEGYTFHHAGSTYFASLVTLDLYSNNAPFEAERWELMAAVPTNSLYAFSHRMFLMFTLDIAAMLVLGIIASIIIGRKVSAPVQRLSDEVAKASRTEEIPHLTETGIQELDGFSMAFTALCRDVIAASTRFLQIIHLASFEIGGYEVDTLNNSVYVTDNFFEILGINNVDIKNLTVAQFEQLSNELTLRRFFANEPDGSVVFRVPASDGFSYRYIRLNRKVTENKRLGVVEDITGSTEARLKIEHERDHDILTGLINRRAFYEKAGNLFSFPDKLKNAALVMLDTDSLKHINDNYGHAYGDKYIRQVAQCLVEASPPGTICSRVSGDEFYVLFYGFKSHEAVRRVVGVLRDALKSEIFEVSSGNKMPLSVSAGVAWYPEDSTDFKLLMKYADHAMYQVKHTQKGNLGEFNLENYNAYNEMITAKNEFVQLVAEERVVFFFQPIISAQTGKVFAYEALMRSDMPTLRSPDLIIKIARQEGRLRDIEDLTWIKAPEFYTKLLEEGKVEQNAYLFVNSVANQFVSPRVSETMEKNYKWLMPRIVTEITESEVFEKELIDRKRNVEGGSGMFALDDYGSGYNSERSLLALSPQFIKVDMSIIRDIDSNTDKQQILANAVTYAHERDMFIVAEGVETMAEMLKVIEIGADLLQGYLIARPQKEPTPVPEQVLKVIKDLKLNNGEGSES